MSFLKNTEMDVSPIQHHAVNLCTEIFWAEGQLESLGNPHLYINQDDLPYFQLQEPRLKPWTYADLPSSSPSTTLVNRANAHLLYFPDDETNEQYKSPQKTTSIVFYFSLFVVQARAPLLSEATLENFTEFWKGVFIPVQEASIHFLISAPRALPAEVSLLYLNRHHIQGYVRP